MRQGSIDLNLAVTLDALLHEKSVTRAAKALNRSQPTVSCSLARLRRHFGDELLQRQGNRYQLTPLGERLAELTPKALAGLWEVFEPRCVFDSSLSERTFRIISSDYGIIAGLQQLARHCAYDAPGVTLVVEPMTPDVVRDPESALRGVDGLMLPHGVIRDFPHVDVTADRWVCVISMDNRRVGDRLDVKDLSELPWVAVFTTSFGDTPLANQMRVHGVTPRDQVIVNSFSAVPAMVAGTDRVAFIQERLVVPLLEAWDLRVVDPPFAVPALIESLWWHPHCDNDRGHQWLRSTIAAVNAIG